MLEWMMGADDLLDENIITIIKRVINSINLAHFRPSAAMQMISINGQKKSSNHLRDIELHLKVMFDLSTPN